MLKINTKKEKKYDNTKHRRRQQSWTKKQKNQSTLHAATSGYTRQNLERTENDNKSSTHTYKALA